MPYIVGQITAEDQAKLEKRGWEFEPYHEELRTEMNEADRNVPMVGVWVDSSMLDVMTGPTWEGGDKDGQ